MRRTTFALAIILLLIPSLCFGVLRTPNQPTVQSDTFTVESSGGATATITTDGATVNFSLPPTYNGGEGAAVSMPDNSLDAPVTATSNFMYSKGDMPVYDIDFGPNGAYLEKIKYHHNEARTGGDRDRVRRILVPMLMGAMVGDLTETAEWLYTKNTVGCPSSTRAMVSVATSTAAYPPIWPVEMVTKTGITTGRPAATISVMATPAGTANLVQAGIPFIEDFMVTSAKLWTQQDHITRTGYQRTAESWAPGAVVGPTSATRIEVVGSTTYVDLSEGALFKDKMICLGGYGRADDFLDINKGVTITARLKLGKGVANSGAFAGIRYSAKWADDGVGVLTGNDGSDGRNNIYVKSLSGGGKVKQTSVDATDGFHVVKLRVEADGDFIVWVDSNRVAATGDAADVGGGTLLCDAPNTWAAWSVDAVGTPGAAAGGDFSSCKLDYIIVEQF